MQQLLNIDWISKHLLPCAYKSLLGIDCPLCGFQRACLLALQGKWMESFRMYPPLLPLVLLGIFFLFYRLYRNRIKVLYLQRMTAAVLAIVFVNYSIKLFAIFQ
jgi:hypothetical protein